MNMNYFELMRTFVTYVIYKIWFFFLNNILLNITNGFDFKFVISKNRL